MNHHGGEPAPGVPAAGYNLEYRVAHLKDRIAGGALGELGVRLEVRGETVLLTGTVPSAHSRDEICDLVAAELAGHQVHCDITVADASSPDHAEDLA
ncbi:BON domain-containing protein [Streptomyces carpinensis]|uniref:BON domain-containing protein n=1 Tax=Streptomyces carpinensis TaxID=66369 RepID=A0ABV1WBR1_9ACTN|nr:BON domain-containing protein [Streptomyces carpinensis]